MMSTAERMVQEPESTPQEAPKEVAQENLETKPEDTLPDKFKAKSATEIAAAYAELEKAYGRQGQEIGELRKWTDTLITSTTRPSKETSNHTEEEIDFDIDPATATREMIRKELATAVKPLQQQAAVTKAQQVKLDLEKNHAGYESIINDPKFGNWVASSNIRSELYKRADEQLQYDAIDELLTTYKALNPVSPPVDRSKAIKEATLESAGTGQSS
jgi:hypothetical protein